MARLKRGFAAIVVVFSCLLLDFGRVLAAPTPAPNPINMTEAKSAFAAKNYEKTIALISPHLDVASKDAFLLLARAYAASGNAMMAMKTLSAGHAKTPEDPDLGTALGQAQFALNREKEAKAILKEVIQANPSYEPAYLAIAEIYEKKNNRYELRLIYQDLLKVAKKPRPQYLKALCELTNRDGLYDLAFTYCQQAIAANPADPLNRVNLANTKEETGKIAEAQIEYKTAADHSSASEPAQFAYARFLDSQKKFTESFAYYKKAVVADPKSARSWQGLGFSALEIQKFQESIDAFLKLCELDTRDGVKHARKAANQMKRLEQPQWFDKFQKMISKCEGY